MEHTPTIMNLHLRYRLWIAEMNFDLNIVRIFEDYIKVLTPKINEPEIKSGIDNFEAKFVGIKKETDELRHEMHILKMELAATSRTRKQVDSKTYCASHHPLLNTRYKNFRKAFDKLKVAFSEFGGRWLD